VSNFFCRNSPQSLPTSCPRREVGVGTDQKETSADFAPLKGQRPIPICGPKRPKKQSPGLSPRVEWREDKDILAKVGKASRLTWTRRALCPEAEGLVPEGRCDRSLARSAWKSVPRKNRPVGYGMIDAANPRVVSHRKCVPCFLRKAKYK
jgi:hypothetical protein